MYLVIDLVNEEVVKKSEDVNECIDFVNNFIKKCDLHEIDRYIVVEDNL